MRKHISRRLYGDRDDKMSYFFDGRKAIKPEDVKVCVLYDPKNGRIVHNHMVITFPGGQRVDEKETERRAFMHAAKLGRDTSKLKALHVSEKDCQPSSAYRVDLKTLKLVKLPKPAAPPAKVRPRSKRLKR